MVPGMLVFHAPRLFESVGSATLYVGTLVGVFLLARKCFGTRCAYLSLLTYGLSRNGLFNAGSLWSIGNPFFTFGWSTFVCWGSRARARCTDQCAEGISSEDEYRIVQKPPVPVDETSGPESWKPLGSEVKTHTLTEHFAVPRDPRFHLMKQFGDFGVSERTVSDGQR